MKVVPISSWLNFGHPAPPGRGSAAGWKFLAPHYYSQRAVFASLRVLLSFTQLLDVGLLVVMIWLHCTTYSSSSSVVTTTSIIFCFNKHWLTQVHLENGRLKQRFHTSCFCMLNIPSKAKMLEFWPHFWGRLSVCVAVAIILNFDTVLPVYWKNKLE